MVSVILVTLVAPFDVFVRENSRAVALVELVRGL